MLTYFDKLLLWGVQAEPTIIQKQYGLEEDGVRKGKGIEIKSSVEISKGLGNLI